MLALEKMLERYEGTIIFVSHDRYFVNKIANNLIVFEDNDAKVYKDTTYAEYERTIQANNQELEETKVKVPNENKVKEEPKVNLYLQNKEKARQEAKRKKLEKNIDSDSELRFTVNNKNVSPVRFEAEEMLLSIINGAQKELIIVMAYFSPLPNFIKAIHKAWKRGVEITIIIPEHANFQDDLNRKTVKKIMKICKNNLNLYFFKGMIHAKLLCNEETLTMGSTNITKKAFNQLAELNITLNRTDAVFFKDIEESIQKTISESIKIASAKDIKFNLTMTLLESLFV